VSLGVPPALIFGNAGDAGRALSCEQAIDYALEEAGD
jgi:hypothetical protein